MTVNEQFERLADDHQKRWQDILDAIGRLEQRIKALEKDAMRNGSQVVTLRPQIQPVYRTLGRKSADESGIELD